MDDPQKLDFKFTANSRHCLVSG